MLGLLLAQTSKLPYPSAPGLLYRWRVSDPIAIADQTGPQFFGYMGIAAALVFCSKPAVDYKANRPRCRLRYR